MGSTCCSRASRGYRGGRWEMAHPRVTWLDGAEDQPEMRLLPLYPLTEGLTQYQVRRMVASAVERLRPRAGRSVSRRAAASSTT